MFDFDNLVFDIAVVIVIALLLSFVKPKDDMGWNLQFDMLTCSVIALLIAFVLSFNLFLAFIRLVRQGLGIVLQPWLP